MKVDKLKQITNGYQVLINDKYYTVDEDMIVNHQLLLGKTIDDMLFNEIVKFDKAYNDYIKCLKFINYRVRSCYEIKKYLQKNNATDIDFIINKLINAKLIDDNMFAKMYINDRINLSLDGPGKIITDLSKHNIDEQFIKNYLDNYASDFWIDRADQLIAKKLKTIKAASTYNIKNKIKEILYNQGYGEYTTLLLNKLSLDNDKLLTSFIDKIKHKDREYIVNKAQRAGFNYYEILNYLDNL